MEKISPPKSNPYLPITLLSLLAAGLNLLAFRVGDEMDSPIVWVSFILVWLNLLLSWITFRLSREVAYLFVATALIIALVSLVNTLWISTRML